MKIKQKPLIYLDLLLMFFLFCGIALLVYTIPIFEKMNRSNQIVLAIGVAVGLLTLFYEAFKVIRLRQHLKNLMLSQDPFKDCETSEIMSEEAE